MASQGDEQLQQELEHQQQLIQEARRRLRVLEIQRVREGYQVRPEVTTEIETLKAEINLFKNEIAEILDIFHGNVKDEHSTEISISTNNNRLFTRRMIIEATLICALIFIVALYFALTIYFNSQSNATNPIITSTQKDPLNIISQSGNSGYSPISSNNITYTFNITPSEPYKPNIGSTSPILGSETVLIISPPVTFRSPTIYDRSLRLGKTWDYYGIFISLKNVKYSPSPVLIWYVQNNTDKSVHISPNSIKQIDVFDEDGKKYLSSSSSCDSTPTCMLSGFDLMPGKNMQFTNTIDIPRTGIICQKFFILKPSIIDLEATRIWMIEMNCDGT